MGTPEPSQRSTSAQTEERGAALVLLPIAATIEFYALPDQLQAQTLIQFAPQIIAYLAFTLWALLNGSIFLRLGLEQQKLGQGLKLGLLTGMILGGVNTAVILYVFPAMDYDITFLRQTPHAQLPVFVMIPWFVTAIALFIEFNFRGFLLGRLAALETSLWAIPSIRRLSPMALLVSALVFTFDPFMVMTFQHLHWIAVWDGLIWGLIWLTTRNLYVTITAHTIEVIVMYSAVRSVLMS